MIFDLNNERIGRAITTGEYSLPLEHFAVILALASFLPHRGDDDVESAFIDKTWRELALINPDLVDHVRRQGELIDATWVLRIASHLTNQPTGASE